MVMLWLVNKQTCVRQDLMNHLGHASKFGGSKLDLSAKPARMKYQT